VFVIDIRGEPITSIIRIPRWLRTVKSPLFCAHKYAPYGPPFWRLAVANYAVLIGLDAQSAYFCLPFGASLFQRTDKARPRGRRAKRGSPLRGLRCESSAPFSSCAAAAPSGWTPDPPRGEPRFARRRGVPPPNLYRGLGRTFSRVRSFIRGRLPLP
jgi:hypothetical protein